MGVLRLDVDAVFDMTRSLHVAATTTGQPVQVLDPSVFGSPVGDAVHRATQELRAEGQALADLIESLARLGEDAARQLGQADRDIAKAVPG
jgi:ABC-type transporter Mla subunit MlaD